MSTSVLAHRVPFQVLHTHVMIPVQINSWQSESVSFNKAEACTELLPRKNADRNQQTCLKEVYSSNSHVNMSTWIDICKLSLKGQIKGGF